MLGLVSCFALVAEGRVGWSWMRGWGGVWGDCYLVALPGFLILVASLVGEHGLYGTQASVVVPPALWSTESVVVA